jgi:hypothetical protein
MQDHKNAGTIGFTRVPWNKGKLIGAKPPLRPKHVWSIRTKLQIEGRTRSIWPSIASCVAAMSSPSKSRMLRRVDTQLIGPRSDRKRPVSPSGSS